MSRNDMRQHTPEDTNVGTTIKTASKGEKSVLRAFILSILMLVGLSCLIQGSQFFDIAGGIDGMTAPYVSGLLFLILALFLNLALRGRTFFRKFSLSEMAVGYSVLSVGIWIAGAGIVGFTVGVPTYYYFAANRLNSMYKPLFNEMSSFLAVKDLRSLVMFYRGGQSTVPWDLWVMPILVLTVFWTLFFFLTICVSVVYRKQWTEYEHLQYPLARAIAAVSKNSLTEIGVDASRPLWQNNLVYAGAILPVLLGILRLFNLSFPGVPVPTGYIQLSDFFTEPPWNVLQNWPGIGFYYDRFLLMGVGYLLSLDATFSVWFLYLLFIPGARVMEALAGRAMHSVLYPVEFSRGAIVGITVILTWNSRRELIKLIKIGLGFLKEESDDHDEPLPYKVAFWGGLGSLGLIFLFCNMLLGMSLWFITYLYLFVIANMVWFGRLRAEIGYPDGFASPEAMHYSLYALFPNETLGMNNAIGFAYYHVPQYAGYGPGSLGLILHNYKLGDLLGVKRRTLSAVMLIACFVALLSGYFFALPLIYKHGFDNANAWLAFGKTQTFFHMTGWFSPVLSWGNIGGGLVFALLVGFLRNYFIWFPLNPVAAPIMSLGFARVVWGPFLIAWLIRSLVLRYGGVSTDRRLRPLFVGLIVGSVAMSVVSVFHGLILRLLS